MPQCFRKKALCSLGIAGRAELKLQRLALRIDRSIKIHPNAFDLYVHLVNMPGSACSMQVRTTALLQFGSRALHPTGNGRVIDVQSSFQPQFLKIAITERVPQIPMHAQENDVGFEMAPFERLRLCHEWSFSATLTDQLISCNTAVRYCDLSERTKMRFVIEMIYSCTILMMERERRKL